MKKIIILCLLALLISPAFAKNEKILPENFTLSPFTSNNSSFALSKLNIAPIPDFSKIKFFVTKYSDTESKQVVRIEKKKDWLFTALTGSYVVLSVLDIHSTYKFLEKGHVETNPLWSRILSNKPLTILLQTTLRTGIVYLLHQINKKSKVFSYVIFGILVAGQTYVVWHNYKLARF